MTAVDPGLNGCGVSEWEGEKLVRALYVKNVSTSAPKAYSMAWTLYHSVRRNGLVVIERPQVYTTRKTDPNDLLSLVEVGATFAGLIGAPVEWVLPREWKGQVDPDECNRRVLERLSPEELGRIIPGAKSLEHNTLDGIGIGLWKLGRFVKKRIIHR